MTGSSSSPSSRPSVAAAWVEGARLRTLPAAAAPVLVGTAAAVNLGTWAPGRAALALVVALALQVGVNYSNDYSDGIRGTDEDRVGPPRLTGGGLVPPKVVLAAALGCFAVAGLAGLALLWLSGQWWLAVAGVAAVVAAWFYTGGRTPYGYMGIGVSELMVFVFFGLMACVGTTWTQVPQAPWWLWVAASSLGLLSVAMLMVNNIRDIDTDAVAGKRTLAVRLGRRVSLIVFSGCLALPGLGLFAVVLHACSREAIAMFVTVVWLVMAAVPARLARGARTGSEHVLALKRTGQVMLVWAGIACLALLARAGLALLP
ncbi:1,4-dihydroxy-2-naphthoate polyprenyltransferase [Schaalia sp. 19OD2882]|uniref:1,4-dihydroxy-2-naphthoate polyprenyltransferase n=1 Tax=Schaalia sp. 19OD2882 TaxID=2794089 RepID=UPI001C1EACBB|nr:1,4-dihydroxy-2-naphthoate polyprenyltransferase [Schaalia sp. 19OD2882]QWW19300.1 1,4-dihydroxy-2-naphthoate polyprenyltransferase [Schaalia sp. 19OD2882]